MLFKAVVWLVLLLSQQEINFSSPRIPSLLLLFYDTGRGRENKALSIHIAKTLPSGDSDVAARAVIHRNDYISLIPLKQLIKRVLFLKL